MRYVIWGLAVVLLVPAGIASGRPQSTPAQQDPLAAAARQAREQKKQQAKFAKVWDNDNIPQSSGSLSVVGKGPSDTAASADAADDANAPSGTIPAAGQKEAAAAADKKAALEGDLAAAKENLQNLQSDFDILQRKFVLDQQTYYGKTNYSSDKDGAAALNDEQAQLDAKQQEIGEAQRKIADLQAKSNAPTTDGKSDGNPQ